MWVELSRKELINEWETEYSLRYLFSETSNCDDTYINVFLDAMEDKSIWEVRHDLSPHLCNNYVNSYTTGPDELAERIKHMGKDVHRLFNLIENDLEISMPLMVFDSRNETLGVIGGRTRISVCAILNKNFSAQVLNLDKINSIMLKACKKEFIENNDTMSPEDANELWNIVYSQYKDGSWEDDDFKLTPDNIDRYLKLNQAWYIIKKFRGQR